MKRFDAMMLVLCVPMAFAAQAGCSSGDSSAKRGSPAQHENGGGDDAGTKPPEPEPSEGEEGEGEGPGEDAGEMDAGEIDTGAGAVDTGTGVVDTGTGVVDTGTGVVDTGTGVVDTGPVAMTHEVMGTNYSFAPGTLTIKVGDTVRWMLSGDAHTVTSGSGCTSDGRFDSGLVVSPGTYQHTFTAAGTYPYYCLPHCGMGMTGTVIVE